jgi:hypothetical protein
MKIRPVGTKLLHADRETDRRTDMTKLIVDFRNSANAHKNGNFLSRIIHVSLAATLSRLLCNSRSFEEASYRHEGIKALKNSRIHTQRHGIASWIGQENLPSAIQCDECDDLNFLKL